MSMEYPINKVGEIISGTDYVGWNIEIKNDIPNEGCYLILIWSDEKNEGYDDWVGSKADLQFYFLEKGWSVRWDDGERVPES